MGEFPLKVVHLSQTDAGAGAGRAAYRIHRELRGLGVDSLMIVSDRRTDDPTVVADATGVLSRYESKAFSYLEAKISRRLVRRSLFSPALMGYFRPVRDPRVQSADVVCLYWVNGGFVRPEALHGLTQPLVWRLSDMWPFTGGCHYSGSCTRYEQSCGSCPTLTSAREHDLSRRLWERKLVAWKDLNLTVVAPSRWIAQCARESSLFRDRRIDIIPTGVDLERFKPVDMSVARLVWNLPLDKKLILFGALDPQGDSRKGHQLLLEALALLANESTRDQYHAVIFGGSEPSNETVLPIDATHVGHISDEERLALLYAAADVFVCPSLSDNLPNVAIEAIACGCPVAAFAIGGMADIVDHEQNGFLASFTDARELAQAVRWILEDANRRMELSRKAREKAERAFSLSQQAARYFTLYQELAASRHPKPGLADEA